MEGRVICAFSYRLLERQSGRGSKGGTEREWVQADEDGNREREEEGKGRMRDGWLTQS